MVLAQFLGGYQIVSRVVTGFGLLGKVGTHFRATRRAFLRGTFWKKGTQDVLAKVKDPFDGPPAELLWQWGHTFGVPETAHLYFLLGC